MVAEALYAVVRASLLDARVCVVDEGALKQFIGQLTDISFKMFGELNNVRFLAFMSNGDVISHEEV